MLKRIGKFRAKYIAKTLIFVPIPKPSGLDQSQYGLPEMLRKRRPAVDNRGQARVEGTSFRRFVIGRFLGLLCKLLCKQDCRFAASPFARCWLGDWLRRF